MSDFDVARDGLTDRAGWEHGPKHDAALAALDRIEAENQRLREALERILAAPLRGGRWYRESDSPRIIARLALSPDRGGEGRTRPTS